MDVETASLTLLNLPGEIQNKIVGELEPFELLLLRATCRHFRNIIPPLKMGELLVAESSTTGIERDLYACCLCLRLRQALHFADNMMKKQKRKSGGGRYSRFCMQCGLAPPSGKPGYGRGTYITKDGLVSVVCIRCIRPKRPAQDATGKNTQYCIGCWAGTREGQEMLRQEQAQLQQERVRRETEREQREQRRRERRAIWGSDSEYTDEENPEDVDDEERAFRFLETHIDGNDWRDVLL